jgi:hypothetical protein
MMRGALLIAAIFAFVLTCGTAVGPAAAAPIAPSGTAASGELHLIANVCGRNGCVAVQTKRVVHTKPGSIAAKRI